MIDAQFESLIITTMTDHTSKLGLTVIVMFSKQITQDYFKTKWENVLLQDKILNETIESGNNIKGTIVFHFMNNTNLISVTTKNTSLFLINYYLIVSSSRPGTVLGNTFHHFCPFPL